MVYRRTARGEDARAEARARILAAARVLFPRHGYAATTMQQIVAKAETSIGNAYFYFQNKERLLSELVAQCSNETWDATEAAARNEPAGPARVGTIIHANVSSMLGHDRDIAELLFRSEPYVGGIEIVREISVARWLPHLTESFPGRTGTEYQLAATAIFGANRTVIERVVSNVLDVPPARLAREMVRWSLRALGASTTEIEAVVKRVARRRPVKRG